MPAKKTKINFEKSLQELEALVEKLEAGNISLEDAIKYFEQGVALTKSCQKALAEAEQKVKILMEKDNNQELQPFDPDNNYSE